MTWSPYLVLAQNALSPAHVNRKAIHTYIIYAPVINKMICPICIDTIYRNKDAFVSPSCGHVMHTKCIKQLLNHATRMARSQGHDAHMPTCPTCRQPTLQEFLFMYDTVPCTHIINAQVHYMHRELTRLRRIVDQTKMVAPPSPRSTCASPIQVQ
jgi:hypothetical protein